MTAKLYRHVNDGEVGKMVTDIDGRRFIEVERGDAYVRRSYIEHMWTIDRSDYPISKMQVARIAFEADRALARTLTLYKESQQEWASLRDEDRIGWTVGPPRKPSVAYAKRRKLYDAVVAVFPEAT